MWVKAKYPQEIRQVKVSMLAIVFRNIEIEPYSKVEFETKEFLISLPTRSTYDYSGNGEDYRAYVNKSPRQTTVVMW